MAGIAVQPHHSPRKAREAGFLAKEAMRAFIIGACASCGHAVLGLEGMEGEQTCQRWPDCDPARDAGTGALT